MSKTLISVVMANYNFGRFLGDAISRTVAYCGLWLTFWVNIWIANQFRRKAPRLYEVLAGGR